MKGNYWGGTYKKRYAVFGHYKDTKKLYEEYVYDTCIVFAREQFKIKYPNIVIDIIKLAS